MYINILKTIKIIEYVHIYFTYLTTKPQIIDMFPYFCIFGEHEVVDAYTE